MREKAKFVCFNYMQPQKVKFKSVQINMRPQGILSSFRSFYTLLLLYFLFMSFLHIHTKILVFLDYFTSHILLHILLSDFILFYFILFVSPLEFKTVV